jgi:MFS family permease
MELHSNNATPVSAGKFPPGLHNIFLFGTFNALSFQIVLSSPMVLYAKSLGASSTILGIIAGMMPLLVILQIPAASHLARVGYRRFVLGGWTARVAMIFAMCLVPLTERFLDAANRLALILILLFTFNLSRGISSAGWLPWITALVPAALRGRYLAREAAWGAVGSLGAFLLAGLVLGQHPAAWQFSVVFLLSAIFGATSLGFLGRIPDVPAAAEETSRSTAPVPWRAIAGFPPFRRLLWFQIGWSLASGGLSTFVVAYLKVQTPMTEQTILLASSVLFLGGLSSLWLMGLRLDRYGSRPVIGFSLLVWLFICAGWTLVAGRVLAPTIPLVVVLQFLMGLGTVLINMSATRLAMVIVPEMGRAHFFAMYSVVGSLALGISPVLWGVMIDALRPLDAAWGAIHCNRFSMFFAAAGVVFLVTIALAKRLQEHQAAPLEDLLRDLLIQSPQRIVLRFWPR